MSQENVDILHRVYELTETRGVEGLLELATDDIIWISDPRFPGGDVSIEVEEILDLDDRALGITRFHGVAPNRPQVDWLWCHLVSFREGCIDQAQSFLDKGSALEAAGLSE